MKLHELNYIVVYQARIIVATNKSFVKQPPSGACFRRKLGNAPPMSKDMSGLRRN